MDLRASISGFILLISAIHLSTDLRAEDKNSHLSPLAQAIVPADVLSAVSRLPANKRAGFCPSNSYELDDIEKIEPILKIKGFTSRMSDVADTLPGVRPSEKFATVFGANSVAAFATSDDATKRRLISLLAKWASAGAFLESESCVRSGQLITSGNCGEWRKPDGTDLSAMKDATFSTFLSVGLIRAYYVALADSAPGMMSEHAAIKEWIGKVALWLKKPSEVYFGLNMGWYWPSIIMDLAAGRKAKAIKKLKNIEIAMLQQVNDDGSIKDRTTRGDRAMWYQHTSIDEIVISMELMRAAGMPISDKLEKKLHSAVTLFVAAVDDPKTIDKWAKQAYHAVYTGKQDWHSGWENGDFAGSWFHIYPYRYPEQTAAKRLRELVPIDAQSATRDTDFGFGIGCLYNAAAAGR